MRRRRAWTSIRGTTTVVAEHARADSEKTHDAADLLVASLHRGLAHRSRRACSGARVMFRQRSPAANGDLTQRYRDGVPDSVIVYNTPTLATTG